MGPLKDEKSTVKVKISMLYLYIANRHHYLKFLNFYIMLLNTAGTSGAPGKRFLRKT